MLFLLLPGVIGVGHAQAGGSEDCPAADPDDPFSVYLLTVGPGQAAWSAFGHTGLWLSGGGLKEDVVFNWGTYNSKEQDILMPFLQGTLEFWLSLESWQTNQRRFERTDRAIFLQHLDLPPDELKALGGKLEFLSKPANRTYVYHPRDRNCTSLVRDLIDDAIGGALRTQLEGTPTSTARREAQRHLEGRPAFWFGWSFVASAEVDPPLDLFGQAFMPDRLHDALDAVELEWPDGDTRPLVDRRCTVRGSTLNLPRAPEQPPDQRPAMLGIGLVGGGGLLASAAKRRDRLLGLVLLPFALASGLLATATMVVAAISAMRGFGWNENWFQANPLTLVAGVCAVPLIFGRSRVRRLLLPLSLSMLGLSVAGALLGLLPAFDQDNQPFILLYLPLWLGLAVGLWRSRSPAGTGPSAAAT
jgi:Domain of unknown function (DUF4105)